MTEEDRNTILKEAALLARAHYKRNTRLAENYRKTNPMTELACRRDAAAVASGAICLDLLKLAGVDSNEALRILEMEGADSKFI